MEYCTRAKLAMAASLCVWNIMPAQGYSIDANKDNSLVRFHIFYPGYGKIEGRFSRLRGKIDLNENNPTASKIQIEIDTASINSNYQARDYYLRSAMFLSTRKHPKAVFKSSAVTIIDKSTVIVRGYLTLRGVTRAIKINSRLTHDRSKKRDRTFRGTTSFHLSDFGINNILGPFASKLFLTVWVDGTRR